MAIPTRLGPGRNGKRAQQEHLPHRHALNALTGGDPAARRIGNYAKATPLDLTGVATMGQPSVSAVTTAPTDDKAGW